MGDEGDEGDEVRDEVSSRPPARTVRASRHPLQRFLKGKTGLVEVSAECVASCK